ncbi:MAG: hypothetical protein J6B75_02030 [Ruminococcus sp.]|nr:hypothetical protein [Ruminococcus sp.]
MTMKEEMLKVQSEGKVYIPPYKLNGMMQTASKIVKLLTTENGNAILLSYDDMKIIMKMVDKVLEEHSQPSCKE